MSARSLDEWLRWQETLHPRSVDLSLVRVREVLRRLALQPPPGAVFTVAGTNGKGSTVTLLEAILRRQGRRTALYTSPHLCHYTERVRIDGEPVDDAMLAAACAAVEDARHDTPLTYFEFGTLAAFVCFAEAECQAWVLEVGLGGRLDAVNALDADYALITTIGLDHQEWLGDDLESIGREKAGILRPGVPAFYGDSGPPQSILTVAREVGADLQRFGVDFGCSADAGRVAFWVGREQRRVAEVVEPAHWSGAQRRNASIALAALSAFDARRLAQTAGLPELLTETCPPGRFERVERQGRQWVLDVAHNPQAAEILRQQLDTLPTVPTTVVLSLLADKAVADFVKSLAGAAVRWIVCPVDDPRSSSTDRLLHALAAARVGTVTAAASPNEAFATAARDTPVGGRVVVCGSFRLVGPGREWLGLYSRAREESDGSTAR